MKSNVQLSNDNDMNIYYYVQIRRGQEKKRKKVQP